MKKLMATISLCGMMLMGQKLADFKPRAEKEVLAKERGTLFTLDFEKKELPKGFVLSKGYQHGRGFGENGNGGLFLKRGPGEAYVFSYYEVPGLKLGNVYRFSASV